MDPTTSRADLEREVAKRALEDEAFHGQLIADPKKALKAAFGLELPPGVQVHVLQETPSEFYLVLPPRPGELSDTDLEKVAGGVSRLRGWSLKTQPD